MNRRRALIFSMFLCSAVSTADAQAFDPAKVGPPLSQAPAELYRPIGAAPAGAIIVLHGCDGIGPHIASGRDALQNGDTRRC